MKRILAILLSAYLLLSLTACMVSGQDGKDGKTPYIQDGYWYIDGVNTGVRAEGLNGTNGTDGKNGEDGQTPYIQDGYWYIGGVNTGISVQCPSCADKENDDNQDSTDDGTNGDGNDNESDNAEILFFKQTPDGLEVKDHDGTERACVEHDRKGHAVAVFEFEDGCKQLQMSA